MLLPTKLMCEKEEEEITLRTYALQHSNYPKSPKSSQFWYMRIFIADFVQQSIEAAPQTCLK